MDATSKKLINFARSLRFKDLPDKAVIAAKQRIISSLGVALGAYDAPPIKIARSLAQPVAAGPASHVWGTDAMVAPDVAAFINSAMVRVFDMSDTRVMAAVSHPADAFPAILAVAEAQRVSGRELLLATTIAYEVQCRFVDVVPYNHKGWDQTTVVALGSALGCGRLLGLNEEQLYHALSISIVSNLALNQTRTGTLSMWKGMAGAAGARAGVFAAYLASKGMTGPQDVFEGKFGLWKQMMGGQTFSLPIPDRFENHTFAVQQTMIKSFPIRFHCHLPVFTAFELRKKIKADEIESLKIESIRQAFGRWMDLPEIWKPETRETADHSLPCTVAMAILDGEITPETFERQRYKDKDVLDFMQRITIELPDEFADPAPEIRCCRMTATTRKNKQITVEQRRTTEDDERGMTKAEIEGKFNRLTKNILKVNARKKILDTIWNLDKQKSIDALIKAMVV